MPTTVSPPPGTDQFRVDTRVFGFLSFDGTARQVSLEEAFVCCVRPEVVSVLKAYADLL